MPWGIESKPRFPEPAMAVTFKVRGEGHETALGVQHTSTLLKKRHRVVDVLDDMGHQDCVEGACEELRGVEGSLVDFQPAPTRDSNGFRIDVLAHHVPPEVAHLPKPRTVSASDIQEPSWLHVVQIFLRPSVVLL